MAGVLSPRVRWRAVRSATLVALLVSLAMSRSAPLQAEPTLEGAPVRLVLPVIEVDAEVNAFALNDDLSMPVPQRAELAAWYTYSSLAGGAGNVVLAGHRDWQRRKGIFYDLGKLQEGDEVWLQDAAANWYLYTVAWSISIDNDNAPINEIAGYTDTPSVTLITCSGTFDRAAGRYVERRVVRAHLEAAILAGDY